MSVRSLIDRFLGLHDRELLDIATDYRDVVFQQRDVISRQQAEILQLKLEYSRWGRAVIENFLRASENGIDLSEALVAALRDFDDEIARLEEHSVA
jgi:hypothetical protein